MFQINNQTEGKLNYPYKKYHPYDHMYIKERDTQRSTATKVVHYMQNLNYEKKL
jgi:hypothetical protein